jgi:hypothetical protein
MKNLRIFAGIALVAVCAIYAVPKIYNAVRSDRRQNLRAQSAQPSQSVDAVWRERLRQAPGTSIEATSDFAERINSGAMIEIVPGDGSYSPPAELQVLARDLPGAIILAMTHDRFAELQEVLDSHGVYSQMPFESMMTLSRMTSPSADLRKIELDKTVVKLYDLASESLPPELKSRGEDLIKDRVLPPGKQHFLEMAFRIAAKDGAPNTVSLFVWAPEGQDAELLGKFQFANYVRKL